MIQFFLELNPVFRREIRARWRHRTAFATLFLIAAPLALGMILLYASMKGVLDYEESAAQRWAAMPFTNRGAFADPEARISAAGRELYEEMIRTQLIAWLLIAPAITSPMIALERERGLLDALLLANLPSRRVVLGKWLAALSFLFLLMLVPLPVTAICFFFGGFSPRELVQATAFIIMAIASGAALGIWCSSRRPRPILALRDAFVVMALWTAMGSIGAQINNAQIGPLFVRQVAALCELTNSYSYSDHLLHLNSTWDWPINSNSPSVTRNGQPIAIVNFDTALLLHLGAQAALTLLLLIGAMRATARPLREVVMMERQRWTERLRAYWKAQRAARERELLSPATQEALLREIPFLSKRSFNNPVFGRELRGKIRWRSAPLPMQILLGAMSLLAAGAYVYVLDMISTNQLRDSWEQFTQMTLAGLVLYAGSTAASAFTREREGGTWEGVRLSLLRPEEIMHGKFWPIVITSGALTLPVWPALLLHGLTYATDTNDLVTMFFKNLIAFLVLAVAGGNAAATGLLISWFSKRTPVAVGITTSLLLALFLLLPYGISFSDSSRASLASFSPAFALEVMRGQPYRQYSLTFSPDVLAGLMAGINCVLFMVSTMLFQLFLLCGFLRGRSPE